MPWEIKKKGHVAIVTMNTNPLSFQNEAFFRDLDEAFDRLEADHPECAVILTGTGNTFSAGLDFNESFSVFGSGDPKRFMKWFDRYRATNLRIFSYPRPTVAAINGHAYAGGLITALNCDFRISAEGRYDYCLNEVPIGIPMPAVYLEIIRYAVGTSVASRASLFGEKFDAQAALKLGIVHEVVSPAALIDRAITKASSIAPESFDAYQFSKSALQAATLEAIQRLDRSHDRSIGKIICSKKSLRSLAARYEEIKGKRPGWDPR
jgi:enoyl-CoA hydratase